MAAVCNSAVPWFTFPGENSIRVSDVIRDHLRALAVQQSTPDATMAAILTTVRQFVPALG